MEHIIEEILVDSDKIQQIVRETADRIGIEYDTANEVVVLYILEGAAIFAGSIRQSEPMVCEKYKFFPIKASSYYNRTSSSGKVQIDLLEAGDKLAGRHILIIDDILDTGNTLSQVVEEIKKHNPISVKTCVMVERFSEKDRGIKSDFSGIILRSDAFLIGYGLDYRGRLRELPYIAAVKQECCF